MVISANATREAGSLRDLRKAAGLSQEQVARMADCSTGYLRLIESGYCPDPEVSPKLRAIVKVVLGTQGPTNSEGPAGNGTSATSCRGGGRHGTG